MSKQSTRSFFARIILTLTVVVTVESTWAADAATAWRLGFELAWVHPSGDFAATAVSGNRFRASYDSGFGGGVHAEYRFSHRYGVELSVLSFGSMEVSSASFGNTAGSSINGSEFTPLMVGLNVHLTRDRSFDVYAGPMLVLVRYSDLDLRAGIGSTGSSVSVDTDVTWGAIVGIEVPLRNTGWLLGASLRFIDTDIGHSGDQFSIDSDFDPLILSVGFGYRF